MPKIKAPKFGDGVTFRMSPCERCGFKYMRFTRHSKYCDKCRKETQAKPRLPKTSYQERVAFLKGLNLNKLPNKGDDIFDKKSKYYKESIGFFKGYNPR